MIFEIKGDVFSAPQKSALMQCISADASMSKGIAAEFKKRYPGLEKLKSQRNKVGSMIPLALQGRVIYNLCTKLNCWDKPEVSTLQACLLEAKEHALLAGLKDISLPRIGTGLDELNYEEHVLPSLKMVFKESGLNIWVYSFETNKTEE